MNKNEKRIHLAQGARLVVTSNLRVNDVLALARSWKVSEEDYLNLTRSVNYVARVFQDEQQTALRAIHWLAEWVERQ